MLLFLQILSKFPGKELEGKTYEPLFPYFASMKAEGAFRVTNDKYVKEDGGTGVVHNAPAFGEDDMRVCLATGAAHHNNSPSLALDRS